MPVANIIQHPDFKRDSHGNLINDISLLRLEKPLDLSVRSASALPLNTDTHYDESQFKDCEAAGWGTVKEGGRTAHVLKDIKIPLWPEP